MDFQKQHYTFHCITTWRYVEFTKGITLGSQLIYLSNPGNFSDSRASNLKSGTACSNMDWDSACPNYIFYDFPPSTPQDSARNEAKTVFL
jgi:hypothetical protein